MYVIMYVCKYVLCKYVYLWLSDCGLLLYNALLNTLYNRIHCRIHCNMLCIRTAPGKHFFLLLTSDFKTPLHQIHVRNHWFMLAIRSLLKLIFSWALLSFPPSAVSVSSFLSPLLLRWTCLGICCVHQLLSSVNCLQQEISSKIVIFCYLFL